MIGAAAIGVGSDGAADQLKINDAGQYSKLAQKGVPNELAIHHMPQNALGFLTRGKGGALVMEKLDHHATRNFAGR